MNILVAAWGSAGEHIPVAELAGELAASGAVVHVLANRPFRAAFGPRVASFTPLRMSPDDQDFSDAGWFGRFAGRRHARRLWRDLIDPLVEEQFAAADRILADRPIDLVLASKVV